MVMTVFMYCCAGDNGAAGADEGCDVLRGGPGQAAARGGGVPRGDPREPRHPGRRHRHLTGQTHTPEKDQMMGSLLLVVLVMYL